MYTNFVRCEKKIFKKIYIYINIKKFVKLIAPIGSWSNCNPFLSKGCCIVFTYTTVTERGSHFCTFVFICLPNIICDEGKILFVMTAGHMTTCRSFVIVFILLFLLNRQSSRFSGSSWQSQGTDPKGKRLPTYFTSYETCGHIFKFYVFQMCTHLYIAFDHLNRIRCYM